MANQAGRGSHAMAAGAQSERGGIRGFSRGRVEDASLAHVQAGGLVRIQCGNLVHVLECVHADNGGILERGHAAADDVPDARHDHVVDDPADADAEPVEAHPRHGGPLRRRRQRVEHVLDQVEFRVDRAFPDEPHRQRDQHPDKAFDARASEEIAGARHARADGVHTDAVVFVDGAVEYPDKTEVPYDWHDKRNDRGDLSSKPEPYHDGARDDDPLLLLVLDDAAPAVAGHVRMADLHEYRQVGCGLHHLHAVSSGYDHMLEEYV